VEPPAAPEAPVEERVEAPSTTTYTVRTGDTLGDIGARYGVTREEIARLNGIEEPDLIFPGQELRIPTA
jgi:LysM repeat protein